MSHLLPLSLPFFFHHPAPTEISTLSLHDALPIFLGRLVLRVHLERLSKGFPRLFAQALLKVHPREVRVSVEIAARSEEHTSELQSRRDLVCRLLLEKKKRKRTKDHKVHAEHVLCQ